MKCKNKYIVSVFLAVLFLMPEAVKLADNLFHHHFHSATIDDGKKHLFELHEKCPVHSYVLSIIISPAQTTKSGINFTACSITIDKPLSGFNNKPEYSFLLRAPPSRFLFVIA